MMTTMIPDEADAEVEPVPAPKDIYSASTSGIKIKFRKLDQTKKKATKSTKGRTGLPRSRLKIKHTLTGFARTIEIGQLYPPTSSSDFKRQRT